MQKNDQTPADFNKEHPNFNFFFNKIAWAALAAIAWYASSQLANMNASINELNKNVAVMMAQMQGFSDKDRDLKQEIERISERVERCEKRSGR